MNNFLSRNKYLIFLFLVLELCLLPTEILLFYSNREFVDFGLLFTAIAIIIMSIPMYNLNYKHKEAKKAYEKSLKDK
jgi:hypothetical protein